MIHYSLDASDMLVDVGGAWEDFASTNRGEDLTREYVLGKSLFEFIAGPEIVAVYKSLFAKVRRDQRPLSFTFRCDGPCCRRRMSLSISSLRDQGLLLKTELMEEAAREEVLLLCPDAVRSDDFISICCICSNVKSEGDRWVSIEEESARRRLLEYSPIPSLSHGYCPDCLDAQLRLCRE